MSFANPNDDGLVKIIIPEAEFVEACQDEMDSYLAGYNTTHKILARGLFVPDGYRVVYHAMKDEDGDTHSVGFEFVFKEIGFRGGRNHGESYRVNNSNRH